MLHHDAISVIYIFSSFEQFSNAQLPTLLTLLGIVILVRFLQEEKVAVVPGTAFGDCGEGFLRISYAYSIENLKVAIGRLAEFVEKLRKEHNLRGRYRPRRVGGDHLTLTS